METIFSILALAGMGFAAYKGWKWMMRSGVANARAAQPLTPNDLKVLEDSAARLTADLRATADECVQRISEAIALAEQRLRTLETASYDLAPVDAAGTGDYHLIPQDVLADSRPARDLAREAGMPTGEVELLRNLGSITELT